MATGSAIELGVLGTDDTSDLPTWKQYILVRLNDNLHIKSNY